MPSATEVQVAPDWLPLYHHAPVRFDSVIVAVVWVMSVAERSTVEVVLKVALAISLAALQPVAP